MSWLPDDAPVTFFPRRRLACRTGRVTEGQRADTDDILRKIESPEDFFAFLTREHLVFAVDPAGSEPDAVGGVHHVPEYQAAVLDRIFNGIV